jgi:hypothetical protein
MRESLKGLFMFNRVRFVFTLGTLLMSIGLAMIACTPDKTAPTLGERSITPVPNSGSIAMQSVANLQGTPIAEVPPFTDTECLTCHQDQQRLIDNTLPVVEIDEHALSSGPG